MTEGEGVRIMSDQAQAPWWRTRGGVVLLCFLAIAGFFLVTEHTAHVLGALPYLLLAACPLMHLFMHHGQGGHDQGGGRPGERYDREQMPMGGRDDAR
jgi:uncharacterized membrane protein